MVNKKDKTRIRVRSCYGCGVSREFKWVLIDILFLKGKLMRKLYRNTIRTSIISWASKSTNFFLKVDPNNDKNKFLYSFGKKKGEESQGLNIISKMTMS